MRRVITPKIYLSDSILVEAHFKDSIIRETGRPIAIAPKPKNRGIIIFVWFQNPTNYLTLVSTNLPHQIRKAHYQKLSILTKF